MERPTDAQLALLDRIERQASPPPWREARMIHDETGEPLTREQMIEYVTNTVRVSGGDSFYFVYIEKDDGPADVCHTGNGPTSLANSALIASMRNNWPGLLARLRQEREAREKAESELAEIGRTVDENSPGFLAFALRELERYLDEEKATRRSLVTAARAELASCETCIELGAQAPCGWHRIIAAALRDFDTTSQGDSPETSATTTDGSPPLPGDSTPRDQGHRPAGESASAGTSLNGPGSRGVDGPLS